MEATASTPIPSITIRDFTGADFEPASKLLGSLRHASRGERSYWYGADELCAALAASEHGFVAQADSGTLAGVALVASPRPEDHNQDLRSHWRGQRTVMLAVCRTLGINPRADAVQAAAEGADDADPRITSRLGENADKFVLFAIDHDSCDAQTEHDFLEQGLSWLAAHGVAVADEPEEPTATDTPAPNELPILPSVEDKTGEIGAILDEYSGQYGSAFVNYNYHVERDGRLVAGIIAWAVGSDVHIDMLAVDESERRNGLGARLLTRVEQDARRDGCTTASVDTFSFQSPDYYPARGYREVFRYPLADGTERIYFSKSL